jgi:hypothetical protein
MSEAMHNEFDRGEGMGEAREEAAAETEATPSLELSEDDIYRILRDADDADGAHFLEHRNLDLTKPLQVLVGGVEIANREFKDWQDLRNLLAEAVA